jgi:hypothetical protein
MKYYYSIYKDSVGKVRSGDFYTKKTDLEEEHKMFSRIWVKLEDCTYDSEKNGSTGKRSK